MLPVLRARVKEPIARKNRFVCLTIHIYVFSDIKKKQKNVKTYLKLVLPGSFVGICNELKKEINSSFPSVSSP